VALTNYLQASFDTPFFADGTMQFLQHSHRWRSRVLHQKSYDPTDHRSPSPVSACWHLSGVQ